MELVALERLDEASTQLQNDGNFLGSLECIERGLLLRQHLYGPNSDEVKHACVTAGELCNLLAMKYLQQEEFNITLELLKKAEILTERDPAGRAATLNNFACYYRRKGKLHAALQYLQKSLKIEAKISNVQNPADTHINACAVLSQLGRHQTALEHAQAALILLQDELLSPEATSLPPVLDRIAVLSIAYHNIGVEQEFLKKFEQSSISYRKGIEVGERYLGVDHPVTETLRKSLKSSKNAQKIAEQSNKSTKSQSNQKQINSIIQSTNNNQPIENIKLPKVATAKSTNY